MHTADNAFGAFLASRRAKLSPRRAGLADSPRRRVPGLRRNEVANLAGISTEYLARLERGDVGGVSDNVIDALSRALQLDDAEREHLINLARTLDGGIVRRRRKPARAVPESVQLVLDAIETIPAVLRNGRGDLVATNALGRALYSELFTTPDQSANVAKFIFFDARAHEFFPEWDTAANDMVALLRAEAGRDPYDRELSSLVGELSTRSDAFRTRWALQDVRHFESGRKHIHHPVVGDITTNFEVLQLVGDKSLSILLYPPTPGTTDEDAIRLLATWQATPSGASSDLTA